MPRRVHELLGRRGAVAAGTTVAALGALNRGSLSISVALIAFGAFLAAYGLFTGVETAVTAARADQTAEERDTDATETASET